MKLDFAENWETRFFPPETRFSGTFAQVQKLVVLKLKAELLIFRTFTLQPSSGEWSWVRNSSKSLGECYNLIWNWWNLFSKRQNSISKGQNSISKRQNSISKCQNSFSKGRNSFSKRRNSLVPHFICKYLDGFRTKNLPGLSILACGRLQYSW